MRKLASLVEIASCDPIPDTERLSVATMKGKGWRVVTSRGEFAPGDKAVYFEIDSYLPPDDERFAFLRERCLRKFVSKSGSVLREGFRIKTAKLRGVVSQGLLMPLAAFPEAKGMDVGADLTDLLKVDHYDEVKEQLQPAMGNPLNSDAMGAFPSYIPKSDEERLGITYAEIHRFIREGTSGNPETDEIIRKKERANMHKRKTPLILNPFGEGAEA